MRTLVVLIIALAAGCSRPNYPVVNRDMQNQTATPQMTPTFTPTPTATPMNQQTLYLGDSLTAGPSALCSSYPCTLVWPYLVQQTLNSSYPYQTYDNFGVGGISSQDYVTGYLNNYIAQALSQSVTAGPVTRATIFFGMNDLSESYGACNSCINGGTTTQMQATGAAFAANINTIAQSVLSNWPQCKLVICTCPDRNNEGLGTAAPVVPAEAVTFYRTQVVDLVNSMAVTDARIVLGDVYAIEYQSPGDYFNADVHLNATGNQHVAFGNPSNPAAESMTSLIQ